MFWNVGIAWLRQSIKHVSYLAGIWEVVSARTGLFMWTLWCLPP
jgi:hypothetical protein